MVPIHDLPDLSGDLHRRSVKHTQKCDDNIKYPTPWGSGSSWNQHILQLLSANQASYPNWLGRWESKLKANALLLPSKRTNQTSQENKINVTLVASSCIASVDEIVKMANHSMSSIFSMVSGSCLLHRFNGCPKSASATWPLVTKWISGEPSNAMAVTSPPASQCWDSLPFCSSLIPQNGLLNSRRAVQYLFLWDSSAPFDHIIQ